MTISTAHELIAELQKVALLTPAQLDTVRTELGQFKDAPSLSDELVRRGWLTAFQAEQVAQGFVHDLVLGHYVLIELIGEGGMGMVFKARDTRLNRIVALKVIRGELLDSQPDAIRRFRREAQMVAQLMHPNVVVLYDLNEANGLHYLAMEYVEGVDLQRMVQKQGPLPVTLACDYIRQAALGLQHAHERGLVHRDIKPSNLLVTRPAPRPPRRAGASDTPPPPAVVRATGAGVLKILDMGLARLIETDEGTAQVLSALTQVGSIIGTPDFIAPEQAQDATTVDHRADLYSLGCTFYYLLTGKPPYPEGGPAQKLAKHLNRNATPRPVEQIRRGLPPEVVLIVQRLMAKDVNSRFQSAQDVANALAAVQMRQFAGPAVARPDAPVPASGAEDVILPRSQSLMGTSLPPTHAFHLDSVLAMARKTAVIQAHGAHIVTALTFSDDGRLLASGGLDGDVRLWDLAGDRPTEFATFRGQLGEVQALAFEPGAKSLITGSAGLDAHMWRWEWTESRTRTLVPGEPRRVDALAFSRDGKRLAAGADDTVLVWSNSRKGLSRQSVLKAHKKAVKALAFSPDGRGLATAGEDATVWLWEFGWFRTQQKAVLIGHTLELTSVCYSPNGLLLATGSKDGTIRIWDATGAQDEAKAVLQGHQSAVRLVQFTPKGDLLVSAGDGGQVILWDVSTQQPVREWAIDRSRAYSLALSPDARYLATGTSDGMVSLFDLDLLLVEELEPTAAGI